LIRTAGFEPVRAAASTCLDGSRSGASYAWAGALGGLVTNDEAAALVSRPQNA